MRYIGIDPGMSGAIACIDSHRDVIEVQKMPPTRAGIYEAIEDFCGHGTFSLCIEKVWGRPGNGVRRNWTFAMHYGCLLTCLEIQFVRYNEVTPLTWMRHHQCETGGNKKISLVKARETFSDYPISVTHVNADALLIAKYAMDIDHG